MAAAYRSGAIANNGQSASSATVALIVPAGAQAGDVAIVTLNAASGALTITGTPTGWNLLTGPVQSGSVNEAWLYYKIMPGTIGSTSTDAGGTATWTLSSTSKCLGLLDLFSGVDQQNPIEIIGSTTSIVTNTVLTAPTITTYTSNSAIYEVFSGRTATTANAAGTPSASITATGFAATAYSAVPQLSLQGAYRTANQTTPGAIGGDTMTYVTTNTNWVTYTLNIIAPARAVNNNYQFVKVGDGMSTTEKIR